MAKASKSTKRGRPPLPKEERKSYLLAVRITEDLHEKIAWTAEKRGESFSNGVRFALGDYAAGYYV